MNSKLSLPFILLVLSQGVAAASSDALPDNCGECLSTEFCGKDGKCHRWGCDNWYQYAPEAFSGHNASDPVPPLECRKIEDPFAEELKIYGVIYGCGYHGPGTNPIDVGDVPQPFTRQCLARTGPESQFECYDMAEGTDFRTFLDGSSSFLSAKCHGFKYQVEYHTNDMGYMAFPNQTGGGNFSENSAMSTMYAELSTAHAPDPTQAPTSQSNWATAVSILAAGLSFLCSSYLLV